MIIPSQAIVRPRVVSPETGESLPLEELVEEFFARHDTGAIEIVGAPGSGKSTAIAHLAETLSPGKPVLYLDDASPQDVASAKALRLVVYATGKRWPKIADVSFELSPWGDDELIEFVLATQSDRCQSVLTRIRKQPDHHLLGGNPELCRIVLERMASDDSVSAWREVLRSELSSYLATPTLGEAIQQCALERLWSRGKFTTVPRACLEVLGADSHLLRLLRHLPVQVIVATHRLCAGLEAGDFAVIRLLPKELICEMAAMARNSEVAMSALQTMLTAAPPDIQPMAASILHATGTGWVPAAKGLLSFWKPFVSSSLPCLESAQLEGARWPGVRLSGALLNHANLSSSDLSNAFLNAARAAGCRLSQASLRDADLTAIVLRHADLRNADLTGASMKRADLTNANLSDVKFNSATMCGADLREAQIDRADFSEADLTVATLDGLPLRKATLTGANFTAASLVQCDLEGIRLRHAQFAQADLTYAKLTGSIMPQADFEMACLTGARLADIQWERADLRGAELRNCSFFLGSTRSGLVGSPLACEGSRTGFYTDDYDEQGFKSPEEIRKANLRGADLRGAKIDNTDFYLVDLRNAKYTPDQEQHFRRCGAILSKGRGQ